MLSSLNDLSMHFLWTGVVFIVYFVLVLHLCSFVVRISLTNLKENVYDFLLLPLPFLYELYINIHIL